MARLINLDDLLKAFADKRLKTEYMGCLDRIRNIVTAQPVITEKLVKHSEWIPIEYDSYADGNLVWDVWECKNCGCEHYGEYNSLTAYCPDCGADMGGETDGKS